MTAAACRTSVVTSYLLTPQKKLLALSTYPDCAGSILYYLTLLFDGGDNLILYVRFVLLIGFLFFCFVHFFKFFQRGSSVNRQNLIDNRLSSVDSLLSF